MVGTISLIVLAGVFKALMDFSSEDRFTNPRLNKSTGWTFKWRNGDPSQGEAFPLSSTVLVFLTDGWHLFQFFFLSSIELSIAIQFDHWMLSFIGIKILLSGSFELIYRLLKK